MPLALDRFGKTYAAPFSLCYAADSSNSSIFSAPVKEREKRGASLSFPTIFMLAVAATGAK
ncbi:hypothetical protein DQG23_31410 [Paenibacillus contaminans]|uniref:Uncharacterized protein n=1 Tax=Paenibacillus contaminans TaxID=450362 RepID=A0A329M433_9BACL|nr:hypothetical protein DQG23_31410 [Paenibacillus contaminans]